MVFAHRLAQRCVSRNAAPCPAGALRPRAQEAARLIGALVCGLLPCALGCNDLPRVLASKCGNGVTEAGEECDTFAPDGQQCRAPGPGVVGECHFECSPDGDSEPRWRCPADSACGLDGLCHSFTGTYESWGGFLPVVAETMQVGDFDGDGRQDLLTLGNTNPRGQSMPRIYFFDESGRATDPFDPQTPVRSPVITEQTPQDPTEDRRQRIVFATDFGIATLEATDTRRVLPIAYPYRVVPKGWSYRVLRIRGSSASALGDGILLILSGEYPDQTLFMPADPPEFSGVVAALGEPLDELATEVLAGNVIEGADSPCDEALFAYKGAVSIGLLELCRSDGYWLTTASVPRDVLALPKGHSVGHRMLLARVDSDEHLDLLVSDQSDVAYLAFGRGDGTFVADPADPDKTQGKAWSVAVTTANCLGSLPADTGFPLTVADFNADAFPDWVTTAGVVLVRSLHVDAADERTTVEACPGNAPFVGEWSLARAADFNGDGRLDLVAGSASVPDLDFYAGTGLDRMNRVGIATEGPISQMAVGDFDGDLIEDLAVGLHVQQPDAAEQTQSGKVAIAFGSPYGAPSSPVEVGQYSEIIQLASGNYATDDAIAELAVIGRSRDYEGETLTAFIGNPGRHPIASLGLVHLATDDTSAGKTAADDTDTTQTPIACAVGRFSGADSLSLVALGLEDEPSSGLPPRLWYAQGSALATLSKPVPSSGLPDELCAWQAASDKMPPALFAGDIDGDGEDEALVLASTVETDALGLWRVDLPEEGADTSWLSEASPVTRLSTGPGRLVRASHPKLADMDQDGRLDLLLIVADAHGEQQLGIVWNDKKGGLNLSKLETVSLRGDSAQGFAAASDGRVTRWAAVTQHATFLVSRESAKPGSRALVATPVSDAPGGQAVALGDLTGDGLMDLVIAGQGGVRVLAEKQVPQEP